MWFTSVFVFVVDFRCSMTHRFASLGCLGRRVAPQSLRLACNQPTKQTTKPTNQPPTNKPTNQQTNKPTNQQTNKPTNQQTNKPTNQQTNKPTNQPNKPTDNQPTDRSTAQPTNQPTNRPTDQATRVDVKDFLKKLQTVLTFGPPSTIVAAFCLLSTSKFADCRLRSEVVEDTLKKSFGEHQGSDSRMSLTAVSSSSRFKFKAWCAPAGFDITSVTNQHTHQRAELFKEFEELSRLCAWGGAQSAMCLLSSSWGLLPRPQVFLTGASCTQTSFRRSSFVWKDPGRRGGHRRCLV